MNFIEFMFVSFLVIIGVLSVLINISEQYLPIIISQSFRYGKHSYKGAPNNLVKLCEIPKSYFRHFYITGLLSSFSALFLIYKAYVEQVQLPHIVIWILDKICGQNREVQNNSTTILFATLLFSIHCLKRFYETHFVQVFSSTSKINISHYIVGHLHYVGSFITILSQGDGFVKGTNPMPLSLTHLNIVQWFGVFLFLYSCLYQYKSNMILANLRKNNSGKVITEKHRIPIGGYFEYVSSPHMLFEILIYAALCLILQNNSPSLFLLLWVVANQTENAWLTHKWYKNTFPNYPENRRIIYPGLF